MKLWRISHPHKRNGESEVKKINFNSYALKCTARKNEIWNDNKERSWRIMRSEIEKKYFQSIFFMFFPFCFCRLVEIVKFFAATSRKPFRLSRNCYNVMRALSISKFWCKFHFKFSRNSFRKIIFHAHRRTRHFSHRLFTPTHANQRNFFSSRIFRTFLGSAECWGWRLLDGPEAGSKWLVWKETKLMCGRNFDQIRRKSTKSWIKASRGIVLRSLLNHDASWPNFHK